MNKEGRLIILATGADITDTCPGIKYGSSVFERPLRAGIENPFHAGCTVVPDAYLYAGCSVSQSKRNRLFTQWVSEALRDGKDIVLITPSVDMLDKRLRDCAITFSLPKRRDESSLS